MPPRILPNVCPVILDNSRELVLGVKVNRQAPTPADRDSLNCVSKRVSGLGVLPDTGVDQYGPVNERVSRTVPQARQSIT